MKRWRIVQPHPEDRFEPDDAVADYMRDEIKKLSGTIDNWKPGDTGLNDLFVKRKNLQVELAERLYGK